MSYINSRPVSHEHDPFPYKIFLGLLFMFLVAYTAVKHDEYMWEQRDENIATVYWSPSDYNQCRWELELAGFESIFQEQKLWYYCFFDSRYIEKWSNGREEITCEVTERFHVHDGKVTLNEYRYVFGESFIPVAKMNVSPRVRRAIDKFRNPQHRGRILSFDEFEEILKRRGVSQEHYQEILNNNSD